MHIPVSNEMIAGQRMMVSKLGWTPTMRILPSLRKAGILSIRYQKDQQRPLHYVCWVGTKESISLCVLGTGSYHHGGFSGS
jgi:hypothetical protein